MSCALHRRRRPVMATRNEHSIPAGEIDTDIGRACATGYGLGRAREREREGISSAAEGRREDGARTRRVPPWGAVERACCTNSEESLARTKQPG